MPDPMQALLARFAPANTLPDVLPDEPFTLMKQWYAKAHDEKVQPNPNAMTLATLDADGTLSARIVLCRHLDTDRGAISFFTNYESRKSQALHDHPRCALLFHWDALDRQVRIEGPVVRSSSEESDAYFSRRPWESRLGAWSSNQSRPVENRSQLLVQVEETVKRFMLDPSDLLTRGNEVAIPRPPHWGGWRVVAQRVELWLGGPGRVHDRAAWTRSLTPRGSDDFAPGEWSRTRLQP